MKTLFLSLLAFAPFFALPVQAAPGGVADPFAGLRHNAIYNGTAVSADGQSWRNTVRLSFFSTDGNYYSCTGVFVDWDVVLTAAHCNIKNGGDLSISFFRENSNEPEYTYLSGRDYLYQAHPRYKKVSLYQSGTDDMGVVVLSTPRLPEGFTPADYLTSSVMGSVSGGQLVYVIGAGMTQTGSSSDRLYFAKGRITNFESGNVMRISFSGRLGVCGGDSGGPIFVAANGGHLYLLGLTTESTSNLAGHCGSTSFGTFITPKRYGWIQDTDYTLRQNLATQI